MQAWLIKGLALLGELYNGADTLIRVVSEAVLKTIGG